MKKITSQTNSIIKSIKKLSEKKHRDKEKLYLIEGPNLIQEALQNGQEFLTVGVKEGVWGKYDFLIDVPEHKLVEISPKIFESITTTVTPQNIMAVVHKKDVDIKMADRFVVLDELQDPGNVGTIIRTAEAAGFSGVLTVKGTADVFSSKVIRSAAGSLFRIPVLEFEKKEELQKYLEDKNIKIIICDGNAKQEYTDLNLKEKIALIVGNEGNGVSDFFLQRGETVKIPMTDNSESLNAAVAASIVIYESVRQNKEKRCKNI